jgi:hypothetical protein
MAQFRSSVDTLLRVRELYVIMFTSTTNRAIREVGPGCGESVGRSQALQPEPLAALSARAVVFVKLD